MKKYEISYNKGGAAAAPSTGPSIESKQQLLPDEQRGIHKEENAERNYELIDKLLNPPQESPKHLIIGMSEHDILFKLPEKGIYTPIIFEYFNKHYGQYLSNFESYNTYKPKSFDVIFIDAFLHAYDESKSETDSYRKKSGWQNARYLIKWNSILKDDGIICLPFFPLSSKKHFKDPLNGHNRRAFNNLFTPVNPSKTIRDPYLRSNPDSMIPKYPSNIAWKCYTKFDKSTGVTGPGGTIFYPNIITKDRGAFDGFVL